MSKTNYSQLDQDLWILSKFDQNHKGFFVDIGANDGVNLSNSYLLEQHGWTGVCVEPGPVEFSKLEASRKSYNYNICISDFNGKCSFSENGFFGKIDSKHEGATDCLTLEYFLDSINAPKVIDYLSIDVEGGEFDIIRNFPFDKYFIKYITIEHNAYSRDYTLKNNIHSVLSRNFDIEKENVGDFEDWYVNKLVKNSSNLKLGENLNATFGNVYVKNVPEAKQRLDHFKLHADSIGLQYEVFKGIRGDLFVPENYLIKYRPTLYPAPANQYLVGNWASTVAIHLDAMANNYDSYVICDDDTVFKNAQIDFIKPQLPADWDVIILGEMGGSSDAGSNAAFVKIENNPNLESTDLVGCHCIAINKKFYFEYLLHAVGLDTHGKIGDVLLCLLVENTNMNLYKLRPNITYQERTKLTPYVII